MGIAKIVVGFCVIRFYGQGLANQVNGNFVLAHLMGNDAEQVQGVKLIGIGLKNLRIKCLGLSQATGGVMGQGVLKYLLLRLVHLAPMFV